MTKNPKTLTQLRLELEEAKRAASPPVKPSRQLPEKTGRRGVGQRAALPPIEKLHEIFTYCPLNGALIWKQHYHKSTIGKRFGYLTYFKGKPRRMGKVKNFRYMGVYRYIFAMHHGYWPDIVDHINRDPTDDRIENLRDATRAENCQNSGPLPGKKYKGISLRRLNYHATIKGKYLGSFPTAEDAAAAYDQAARLIYGPLAFTNGFESPKSRSPTRNLIGVKIFGETKTFKEWSRDPRCQCSYGTFFSRIYTYGWSPERALIEPPLGPTISNLTHGKK